MKIVVIIPSPSMTEMAKRVIAEKSLPEDVQIETHLVDVEGLKNINFNGVDAVVSRGYSALELKRRYPHLIHVPIDISSYDILRAVSQIRKSHTPKKVGFCGGYQYMYDSMELEELLACPLSVYYSNDYTKIQSIVKQAKEDGCDYIIGGYSAVFYAARLGLQSVMLDTSAEVFANSIDEAIRAVNIKRVEQLKAAMYRTITKSSNEGIIFVDKDGFIGVDNKAAQEMGDGLPLCHKSLLQAFPELHKSFKRAVTSGRNIVEIIKLPNKRTISVTITPVVSDAKIYGAVINLQDISRIQELEGNIRAKLSEKGLQTRYSFEDIVYGSKAMQTAVAAAKRYAQSDANIIIVGATGTGKELFAQSIHAYSARRNGPFVAVNCAALPENLLESELFGYVEGAFTGAGKGGKMGMVEQAHRGTLFLDEITEIPISLQIKLLRVLQEREIRRLGSDKVTRVDVRIIAATNKSLTEQVKKGQFRSDLLYRLDVLRLFLPALSERENDVELLFDHLLKLLCPVNTVQDLVLTEDAKKCLRNYPFTGNIRELRNIVERICVLHKSGILGKEDMEAILYPEDLQVEKPPAIAPREILPANLQNFAITPPIDQAPNLLSAREQAEYQQLIDAYNLCQGRKNEMATMLNINRSTLWRKLKKYNLN